MLNLLDWDMPIRVNGEIFQNSEEAYEKFKDFDGEINIELNFANKVELEVANDEVESQAETKVEDFEDDTLYRVKVRQYMTKEFEFHDKWNEGKPMPMRVMVGMKVEETRNMIKMELFAKPMPTSVCMVCGRTLTNPVSLLYGIGPECSGRVGVSSMNTSEEVQRNYQRLREQMADVEWTGWIPKKALLEMEVIGDE